MNLRTNAAWMLLANLIYSVCQWLSIIALTKLGTAETVGAYSLGLAVVAPIIGFAMSNLRSMQATDIRNDYSFAEYQRFRVACILVACIVISVYAFAGKIPSTESRWAMFLLGLVRGLEAIADVIYGEAQRHERLKAIALSMILRSVLQVVAFAIAFVATKELMPAILASVFVTILTLFAYDYPITLNRQTGRLHTRPKESVDSSRIKNLALGAAPFGIIVTINLVALNMPRYFIAHQMGEAALGYFSSIAYFIVGGSVVVNAIGQSASPRLARYFNEHRVAFSRLAWKLYAFGLITAVLGVVVAWIAGDWVLRVFYTAAYAQYSRELVYVMCAAGLLYLSVLQGSVLTAAHCIKPQLAVNIIVLLGLTVACYVLIDLYGLAGAALAMCVGNAIKLIGQSYLSFRYLRRP